jgi:ATP-dependent Clp protease ATP-binding subunit ClpA
MQAIQSHFPPEFVNRLDEIIVFVRHLQLALMFPTY